MRTMLAAWPHASNLVEKGKASRRGAEREREREREEQVSCVEQVEGKRSEREREREVSTKRQASAWLRCAPRLHAPHMRTAPFRIAFSAPSTSRAANWPGGGARGLAFRTRESCRTPRWTRPRVREVRAQPVLQWSDRREAACEGARAHDNHSSAPRANWQLRLVIAPSFVYNAPVCPPVLRLFQVVCLPRKACHCRAAASLLFTLRVSAPASCACAVCLLRVAASNCCGTLLPRHQRARRREEEEEFMILH